MPIASSCTIIMFHYVRDLVHSRYPEIKGLDMDSFRWLLDTLQKDYALVTAEDIGACLDEEKPLPKRACLLTFDDGYIEHYTEVFPELARRGLSGCFYPPVDAVKREKLLDVNKIHLLLAHNGYTNIDRLLSEFSKAYNRERLQDPTLPTWDILWQQFAVAGRFDSAKVIFFKRVLQHALPADTRTRLCDALWFKVMEIDEVTAAREMYVSLDMLRVMARNGMHIGAHGQSHVWWDKIDAAHQVEEITSGLAMLDVVYENDKYYRSIAYPYGAYNTTTLKICNEVKVDFCLTTRSDVAQLNKQMRFVLPRFDVNDVIRSINEYLYIR